MAGEWLKFESTLPEKAETLAITAAMGWDDPDLTVGKLMRLFRWFDQQTVDGNAPNVTTALLDRIIGVTGFVTAVAEVGWIVVDGKSISLHNFERHNGATAKSRALTAKRVANHRSNAEGNDEGNAPTVTTALAREEKSREEKREEKAPRKARVSLPDSTLVQYLASCKAESRRPIPEGHPVRAYCEEAGITDEMRQIAWLVFKDRHLNADKAKTYRDWPGAFANSVKARWYRLWSVNESGTADWTPNGLQEKRVIESRMQKEAEHAPA